MKILQWYNENSYRKYPLVDDCEAQLRQGATSIDIPNDLFLDFQFVSYVLPAGHVRFYGLTVAGATASLQFMYDTLAEDNPILFTVPLTGLGNLTVPYHATLWTNNTRLQVWLGAAANTWLPTLAGVYTTPVAPAAFMYMQPALSTFQDKHRVNGLIGDAPGSVEISGDIYVQDGYNVAAYVDSDAGILQFYGMPGAGAGRSPARVDPTRPGCDDVLLTINGVYADETGEFRLKGARGVVITPVPASNELQIKVDVTTDSLQCSKQQQLNQPG